MEPFRVRTVEMHTGGEPVRIVTDGYPELRGRTLLDKRRDASQRLDHFRRRLMLEPRGHDGMYGAILTAPDHPDADLAVLFTHNEGYSTMCGHAVIALGRFAVDTGRVGAVEPETVVRIQCPCGPVTARVEVRDGRPGGARFESVPAFAFRLDREVEVPGFGAVRLDVGYGGAFYAVVDAARLGLDVRRSPLRALVDAGEAVARATAGQVELAHPESADLAFIYGTVLTDGGTGEGEPSRNVTIFAGRQVDRSPCGSCVTARIALQAARGEAGVGDLRRFESITGSRFTARVLREAEAGGRPAVIVEVGGKGHYIGEAVFTLEEDDGLGDGFTLGSPSAAVHRSEAPG